LEVKLLKVKCQKVSTNERNSKIARWPHIVSAIAAARLVYYHLREAAVVPVVTVKSVCHLHLHYSAEFGSFGDQLRQRG